jgi:hypothetical protein
VNAFIPVQANKLAMQVICGMTGFLHCQNQGREWRARARLHLRANTRTGTATLLTPSIHYQAFNAVVSLGLRAEGFISANAPLLGELLVELPFKLCRNQGREH